MEEEKLFRDILNVAIINLYTLSKEKEKIILKNFSEKNENHLCVLAISKVVSSLFGYDIYLDMPITKFIFFILRNRKNKYYKMKKNDDGIDIEEFINHIEEANNTKGIFLKIYNEYYKK